MAIDEQVNQYQDIEVDTFKDIQGYNEAHVRYQQNLISFRDEMHD